MAVTDEEIAEAMRAYFDDTHQVAEGAGAAPLAAVLKAGPGAGKRVGVILSGGNVDRGAYQRYLLLSTAIIAVCIAAAYWIYNKRDLYV